MNYKDIVKCFNLKKGDNIWLSSQIIGLALIYKSKGEIFDGNILIDEFQKVLGEGGTILIPTFSYEFSNHGRYDILNTKSTTGALSNLALVRDDFKRTKHPLHSFAVWGRNQDELVAMENSHSFGVDSPFGYCLRENVKQLILGTDYNHALTLVHYAETVCNVPYRFHKIFFGDYTEENGVTEKRSYDYAARKLEIEPTEQFNRIGSVLEREGASKKIMIGSIECYEINLKNSFLLICDDIINNKCKNIYDFNVDRESIFS